MSCSCWVWSNPGSWLCSLILPLVEATVPLRDNSAPEWYGNLLTLQGLQTSKEGITLFLCCGKNPCSLLGYHCQGTLLLLGSCCSSCSPLGFLTHHPSRERKKKKKHNSPPWILPLICWGHVSTSPFPPPYFATAGWLISATFLSL